MNTLFNPDDFRQVNQRISNLRSTATPLWGKMTVNQMLCHISDPFRDFLNIRTTKPVMPSFLRPLFKRMLLGKKPFGKNSPTVRPYLQAKNGGGTKPTDFDADFAALRHLLQQFYAADKTLPLGNHGALGRLTHDEAGVFMWKHLDHHLRQFGV